ncbi:MAG: 3-phosphoshikimate 1-carboxyvinyltransferase, partial [Bacteroidota bacterium]|nr:3-phosphoshikimate 1-carboxyvinyltransferase [Bacteroidota bacterium]
MKEQILVLPPTGPIKVSIQLPASKSISNRALIMADLGGCRIALHQLSDADDTERLDRLLNERSSIMDCGAGGTTLRFLLAWAAIQEGETRTLTGIPHLLDRPHEALVDALNSLGGSIERSPEGFRVTGRKLTGGQVEFDAPISSQYI